MLDKKFIKYTAISGVALLLDAIIYLVLIKHTTVDPEFAGALSYCVGLIFTYTFLVKYVFVNGWLKGKRHYEVTLFSIAGFVGIIVTFFSLKISVEYVKLDPVLAKLCAILLSFVIVYIVRNRYVFKG